MEIRVLGPVELLTEGGRAIPLDRRRQRFVLAALALSVNRLLPVERLVELVWPDGPPRTAVHAIQVCVSQLRTILASERDRDDDFEIDTRGDGYLLLADPSRIDAGRFQALVGGAGAAGDDEQRIAVLTEALELWSGPALSGAAPAAVRERLCHGLDEARLTAIEDRLDAHLRLGRHHAVLGELGEHARAHPTRERPLAQLMLALYRAGRTGDALDAYRRARERLAEEFGLDPGGELRRLELAILREDGSLDLPDGTVHATSTGADTGREPVPRLLPPDVHPFAGRQRELADLDALLVPTRSRSVVISAVSGTAGVGKTALAVHWAHRIGDRFPDGQLYINLRGFDPGGSVVEPADAVRRFLTALGVAAQRIPADLEGGTGLYRSLLAGKRMLVLLDNARDVEQVRPLLPGEPGCLVIVTSRNRLLPLVAAEGAHTLTLDLLSTVEARDLLSRRLGAARLAAEPDAVAEIIERCARLPLALAIAAARAATSSALPLTALAAELREATGALDALDGNDPGTDVRAVFSWSYQTLSIGAARLFRLLGQHPGPDIGAPAAASLAGVPVREVRLLLAELCRAHLLAEQTPGRYSCHDLLRAYAAERAHHDDDDEQRRLALHRTFDHYLHTAHAAAGLLHPQREPIAITPPQPGVAAEVLDSHDAALAWFTAEHPVLLAATARAAENGFDTHAWQLAWALTSFLVRQGRWHDHVALQHVALAATRRLGEGVAEAHALQHLAIGHARSGRLADADSYYRQALDRHADLGDLIGQANAHTGLAELAERHGRPADALHHAKQGLELYRASGNRIWQASALNGVGWGHALLGEYPQALDHCQQALALLQDLNHRDAEAATWDSLGYINRKLGHHEQALACYRQAIGISREIGARFEETVSLTNLGDAHDEAGDTGTAEEFWRSALDILDQLHHPDAERVRAKFHRPAADARDLQPAATPPN